MQVTCVPTSLEDDHNNIKDAFEKFLRDVVSVAMERREKDEQSLLN